MTIILCSMTNVSVCKHNFLLFNICVDIHVCVRIAVFSEFHTEACHRCCVDFFVFDFDLVYATERKDVTQRCVFVAIK